MIDIECIQTNAMGVNTYILSRDGEAVIIDPGDDTVLEYLEEKSLRPITVLLTHGHFDHIGGVAALKRAGASICIHWSDSAMLESSQKNLSVFAGVKVEPTDADVVFRGGETIDVLGLSVNVLHTPGHSKGSVSYLFAEQNVVFTGDTLFHLSAGRVDLPGADAYELYRSIVDILFALPDETTALPGHLRPTQIGFEKGNNPFVKHWKDGF